MTEHEKGRLRHYLTEVATMLDEDDVGSALVTIRECGEEFGLDLESDDDEEIEG